MTEIEDTIEMLEEAQIQLDQVVETLRQVIRTPAGRQFALNFNAYIIPHLESWSSGNYGGGMDIQYALNELRKGDAK